MSHSAIRKVSTVVVLIFFVIFLFFSPFAELYGEHQHCCSAAICNVCFIANALTILRESLLGALMFSAAFLLFFQIHRIFQIRKQKIAPFSLIAFKTEILS